MEQCNQISVVNGSFEAMIQKQPSVLLLPYCAKLTQCDLRYEKGAGCARSRVYHRPAWAMGKRMKMKVISIISFEDLRDEKDERKRV